MVLDWMPDPASLWRPNAFHNPGYMVPPSDWVVRDLTTPGRKQLHVVPGITADAIPAPKLDANVASLLPRATETFTKQLQTPIVNPAQYFTDRVFRDPPPAPSWWSDLRQSMLRDPGHVLWAAASGVVDLVKYVGWNYVDFMDQIKSWDGTWAGLLRHSSLLWRTVVTVLLTAGLLQAGPLFLAITEWARMLGWLLSSSFGLVGDALGMVWEVVEDLVSYVTSLVSRILTGYY